jgi:fatty acid desaturase
MTMNKTMIDLIIFTIGYWAIMGISNMYWVSVDWVIAVVAWLFGLGLCIMFNREI